MSHDIRLARSAKRHFFLLSMIPLTDIGRVSHSMRYQSNTDEMPDVDIVATDEIPIPPPNNTTSGNTTQEVLKGGAHANTASAEPRSRYPYRDPIYIYTYIQEADINGTTTDL